MKKPLAALLYSTAALAFLGMAQSAEAQWVVPPQNFGDCSGNHSRIEVESMVNNTTSSNVNCAGQEWLHVFGTDKNGKPVDYITGTINYATGYEACMAGEASEDNAAINLARSLYNSGSADCTIANTAGDSCSAACTPRSSSSSSSLTPPPPPPPSPPSPPPKRAIVQQVTTTSVKREPTGIYIDGTVTVYVAGNGTDDANPQTVAFSEQVIDKTITGVSPTKTTCQGAKAQLQPYLDQLKKLYRYLPVVISPCNDGSSS